MIYIYVFWSLIQNHPPIEVGELLKKHLLHHGKEARLRDDAGVAFTDSGSDSDDSGLASLVRGRS